MQAENADPNTGNEIERDPDALPRTPENPRPQSGGDIGDPTKGGDLPTADIDDPTQDLPDRGDGDLTDDDTIPSDEADAAEEREEGDLAEDADVTGGSSPPANGGHP